MLLTPPGPAAIAVVRLIGPLVSDFIARNLSKPARVGHCVHTDLIDAERVIDDPVGVLVNDRTLDINLHGGEWIVRECLELAWRFGFQITASDETAMDAGNILEQEMLEALPLARTEETIRILLDQPRLWKNLLNDPKPALQGRVHEILDNRSLWWMLHPPKIAIVGLPNVGKSTLANQLFGRQRSITADLPGTTRDWVGDWANIDGLPIQLIDTPGQRDSTDPIEQAAIAASRGQIEQADLIILVLDPTIPLEPEQAHLRAKCPQAITVINKSDLSPMWDTVIDAVHTIATSGGGMDRLRDRIRGHFDIRTSALEIPPWWTPRQQAILRRALLDPVVLHDMGVQAR